MRHFPPAVFRRTIELLGSAPEYLDAHIDELDQKIAAGKQTQIPRAAAQSANCAAWGARMSSGRAIFTSAPPRWLSPANMTC